MNINEDKFANKSAEEIINDMLIQHKNNSEEALQHIQDILKDDGLTLSKDVKDNLQKAATMLSDKGLKEGWFSKQKQPELTEVYFELYLPFKKEPVKAVTLARSLDDPQVKDAIQRLRQKHPHSTIYIKSALGNTKITEASSNQTKDPNTKEYKSKDPNTQDYKPKAPKKAGRNSGLIKQFLSSNLVKDLAAIGVTAATGGAIQPFAAQPVTDVIMNRTARKFENVNQGYQVNLFTENDKYTCYVGSLGIALALAEKATNYNKANILKENTIICSYDRSLKEWVINTSENELKEDLETADDLTTHSYADLRKDIANIDERLNLIDCGLNPNLIDKRKPKWYNIFAPTEEKVALTKEIKVKDPASQMIRTDIVDAGTYDILVTLNGIDPEIDRENPDNTQVTILKKIPVKAIDRDNGKTSIVYKNGEEFVITVGQFKKLLQDPRNAETLAKFEDKKESAILSKEQQEEFRSLDEWAKKAIDSEYPEWEEAHADEYNLYDYSLPERAKIYQDYKDLNRDRLYQKARELTPDEVETKYGLPKLKKSLSKNKDFSKYMTAFETTRKRIPSEDQIKLDKSLQKALNSQDDVQTTQRKISKIIGYFGAKAQLNQIPVLKNELAKIQNALSGEDKIKFEKELSSLVANKYVDIKTGLPTILSQPKEVLKDINNLVAKYKNSTNTSKFMQSSINTKGVVDAVKEIKQVLDQIGQSNPKLAADLRTNFNGQETSWKQQHIMGDELVKKLNEFLMYAQQVANDNEATPLDTLPPTEEAKRHDNWIWNVTNIENPKSKGEDKSYNTAIRNKISRLVKNDPQAANGYHNSYEKLLKDLEIKYPNDPNAPEIEMALDKFLDTIKDETKVDATVSGALRTGLNRKLNKLN